MTYGLTDEGEWFATGRERTLKETLNDLAPRYDYALIEGYSGNTIPTVALGGRDHAGETVMTAPSADAIDIDDLAAAVDQLDPYETLTSLVAEVKASLDEEYAGAIATFTGRVRRKDDPDDDPAEYLEFEKYERGQTTNPLVRAKPAPQLDIAACIPRIQVD